MLDLVFNALVCVCVQCTCVFVSKNRQVTASASFFVCLCDMLVCACVFVSKEGQVPARASWLMRARTD